MKTAAMKHGAHGTEEVSQCIFHGPGLSVQARFAALGVIIGARGINHKRLQAF